MKHIKISSILTTLGFISLAISFVFLFVGGRGSESPSILYIAANSSKYNHYFVGIVIAFVLLLSGLAATLYNFKIDAFNLLLIQGCLTTALFVYFMISFIIPNSCYHDRGGIPENTAIFLIFMIIAGILYIAASFVREEKQED